MDEKKILTAYRNAAKLVKIYGNKYLPIFDRLHKEIDLLKQQREIKDIALKIAMSDNINIDSAARI